MMEESKFGGLEDRALEGEINTEDDGNEEDSADGSGATLESDLDGWNLCEGRESDEEEVEGTVGTESCGRAGDSATGVTAG